MLAGGFREEGSGVPPGVAQGVERLILRGDKVAAADNAAGGNAFGGQGQNEGMGEAESAGVLLELEDIARERCGHVVGVLLCLFFFV